jgi:hypothetical protein
MAGAIEAEETYIGGKESNKHECRKARMGRGTVGKVTLLGIRERGRRVSGKVLKSASAEQIQGEITASVECATRKNGARQDSK